MSVTRTALSISAGNCASTTATATVTATGAGRGAGARSARYDGAHLNLPGLGDRFTPHAYQRDAVAGIIAEPTMLMDHVVGAVKTGSMLMGAMELKRLGLASQPWIVVLTTSSNRSGGKPSSGTRRRTCSLGLGTAPQGPLPRAGAPAGLRIGGLRGAARGIAISGSAWARSWPRRWGYVGSPAFKVTPSDDERVELHGIAVLGTRSSFGAWRRSATHHPSWVSIGTVSCQGARGHACSATACGR